MSFKTDHSDYLSYESDELYVADLPTQFSGVLQGFITRHCKNERELKIVINEIASCVLCEPTSDWSWDFLIESLPPYVGKLCKGKMHHVMDFLAALCTNSRLSFNTDDLNELLEEMDIGYVFE